MSNNGRPPEPMLNWGVQLRIPVPVRLVRRASKPALMAWMARTLGESFKNMPPEFMVRSADSMQTEAKKRERRLVDAEGKPYRM